MAELIHETAPGAAIAFADVTDGTGDATQGNFAAAVDALAAAGCNIIVDDVSTSDEPTFQLGNDLDTAIASFIADGGDYFTAAGNDGADYDQTTFSAGLTTIAGLGEVTAESFAPRVYQDALTLAPGATEVDVRLSWDQPFASIGGGGASGEGSDDSLSLYLMNGSGQIVAESVADQSGGNPYQDLDYTAPAGSDGHFSIVVALADGPAPTTIRLDLANDPGTLAFQGGGDGDLSGQSLVPGVNNVGAVDVDETPSEDVSPPVVEGFSQYGGGELLFDGNGVTLPIPQATSGIAFVAPDGATTSVGRQFAPFYGTSPAAAVAAGVRGAHARGQSSAYTCRGDGGARSLRHIDGVTGAERRRFDPGAGRGRRGARDGVFRRGHAHPHALRRGRGRNAAGRRSGLRRAGRGGGDSLARPAPGGLPAARLAACRLAGSNWGGSLGAGAPLRDLFLSPDHAVHAEDVLIPIKHLINGVSVRQAGRDRSTTSTSSCRVMR